MVMLRTFASAAAVAATLAGCSHAPDAAPAASSTSTAATAASVWQHLPGNPVPDSALQLDREGTQFGAPLRPGVQLVQIGPVTTTQCGVALRGERGGLPGVITAGHCDNTAHAPVYAVTGAAGDRVPVGEITISPRGERFTTDGDDFAWVELDPGAAATGPDIIAGRWPLTGVMPTAQARALPAGTPVCVTAAQAGVRCGTVTGTTDDLLVFSLDTPARGMADGDSGGLVFAVDQGGNAIAIAMLTTIFSPTMGKGPMLGGVLDRLGVKPMQLRAKEDPAWLR
jgi:hypothetical protein